MSSQKIIGNEYNQWLAELKDKIRARQLRAALNVNAEMLALYWELGKAILEKLENSDWGEKIIPQLATDLGVEFKGVNGFSRSNLFNIRKFYQFYEGYSKLVQQPVGLLEIKPTEIIQQPVGQFPAILGIIPWGHHIQIFTKCKTIEEALFYVQQTSSKNWTRAVLIYHIESGLYRSQGKAFNNFEIILPKPQSELATDLLKSSYNFSFLSLSEEATERELENALIANLKKFLLELGRDFAFIGQQYRLQISDNDYYIDLLFYHTALHCYFVIELKVNEFKPEYAGKLEFYITAIDKQIKKEEDHPTIGLLLCKEVDKIIVEYTLLSRTKAIGVAEYKYTHAIPEEWKNYLPDEEIIKQELSKKLTPSAKPVDEKMNRLKELIQKINTEEADLPKTPEIIKQIFNNIQQPLLELISEKIEEIRLLFNDLTIDTWYNNGFFRGIMTENDLEKIIQKDRDIWVIGFQITLDGFKKASINTFNVSYRLEINLDKYKYTIGLGPGNLWGERVYRQLYTKEDLIEFADKYVEKILDEINFKMESIIKK